MFHLLFNLVGDALNELLNRVNDTGLIMGLVPHLVEVGGLPICSTLTT